MLSKTIPTALTILTIAAAGLVVPSMAQSRPHMAGPLVVQYPRDLLPNYDRDVNGSDASTPGHN
jgi:hypothetical protein